MLWAVLSLDPKLVCRTDSLFKHAHRLATHSQGQSLCCSGLAEVVRWTPCRQGVEWWEYLEGSRELASRWRPVTEGAGADALAAGLAAGLAGAGAAAFLAAGFAAALDAAGAGVAAKRGHSVTPR